MKNIAIFASGNGTNAERIARYFVDDASVNISLILSNNPNAGVLQRAEKLGISTYVFDRQTLNKSNDIVSMLEDLEIDLIVLAGFLWLIPQNILESYPNKIINIHPALLPKYGGKGMYGHHVHDTVINSGDSVSGITIHYVNEKYDDGQIILQKEVAVTKSDTAETLARKIHNLEYDFFPKVIEEILKK